MLPIYMLLFLRRSHRLMVRTSPFHGGNMGSNPVGITNTNSAFLGRCFAMQTKAFSEFESAFLKIAFVEVFPDLFVFVSLFFMDYDLNS